MTDYLEEVLEEETEDREEFRPKRAVVRISRKREAEMQAEDGAEREEWVSDSPDRTPMDRDTPIEDRAEEESALFQDLLKNRRKAVPGEDRSVPEKGRKKRGPESERSQEGEVRKGTEGSAEEETGDFFPDLAAERKRPADRAESIPLRQGEGAIYPLPETEEAAAVSEELAEAERLTRFSETADTLSGAIRSDGLSGWGESGREETAGILLRALGRAGRVSRIVRGGAGTAAVTLTGEAAPVWEPDAEALDRLVRQDARRYDGGFQLF